MTFAAPASYGMLEADSTFSPAGYTASGVEGGDSKKYFVDDKLIGWLRPAVRLCVQCTVLTC